MPRRPHSEKRLRLRPFSPFASSANKDFSWKYFCGFAPEWFQARSSTLFTRKKEKHEMTYAYDSTHSNRNIFIPRDTGSPHDGLMAHISSLGKLARLDFERYAVSGEVIYAIEGDSFPISQQDEEARIGTLAYALKKLGNAEDAAEFICCLNSICEDGDARSPAVNLGKNRVGQDRGNSRG
jgi:hypothetical protein